MIANRRTERIARDSSLALLLVVGLSLAVTGCSGSTSWEVEHSLEIDASASTVWRLLSELEHYPEWNPYSRRVEGTLREGETVRVEAHLRDEVRIVDNRVTRVEVNRALCWHSLNWYRFLAQGTRCRFLEPLPNGRVRLRHHEVMEGPLAGLIERLYRARIEEGLRLVDDALKEAAERAERSQD